MKLSVRFRGAITSFLGIAIHPFFNVDNRFLPEIKKKRMTEFSLTNSAVFILWLVIWILTIFLNDIGKQNYSDWLNYRLTIIFCIAVTWLLSIFISPIKTVSPFVLSLIVTGGYSWATRLGSPVQPEMIIIFPVLILGACYSSFVLNALLVLIVAAATYPFWGNTILKAWVFTYYELSLIPLVGAATIHRAIVINSEAKLKTEFIDFQQKQTEQRYQEIVESFLPKALKLEYSKKRLSGLGVEEALLKVVETKECLVIAVFVDWVGSTEKSKNSEFRKTRLRPRNANLASIANRLSGFTSVAGDGVMAVFPVDAESPDPSRFLKYLKESLSLSEIRSQLPGEMPFGASLDLVDMGNLGSKEYRNIGFSGVATNLAARLESVNRKLTAILNLDSSKSVILSNALGEAISRTKLDEFELKQISLSENNVKVRDFEEMEKIWILTLKA